MTTKERTQELLEQYSAIELAEQLAYTEKDIERLDNELQDKALTDDGILADAYWYCVDLIEPYVGDTCGDHTLIRSVTQSLEFLIGEWRKDK